MRLWIQADHEIVQAADDGIFTGGEFMEFGIFENEIALAHGAFYLDDAVAHHATEARAGIAIATGHRAQSDGITIATGHQYQSENCGAAGEARAGITTGHRSDGITITIATGHR